MDIAQISRDIYEETISEIVLSEFAAWLAEKPDRFETAKRHVRELSLDQVIYSVKSLTTSLTVFDQRIVGLSGQPN
ncbi:hypothetical protein B0J11DRAFT_542567 [Dendryphion nanum]|uniref:Uncharacterized protein n=1 Tax=Dendryphion nanum TaxID=256645 RepID=A0A9P9IAK2_9PLEO|nr:hypothetical protein B0J11DRAFT_542567 [Dendryphion nanum]